MFDELHGVNVGAGKFVLNDTGISKRFPAEKELQ